MVKITKQDIYFFLLILPAGFLGISVIAWDFVWLQKSVFQSGLMNFAGLALVSTGLLIRFWARKELAEHFSYILNTSKEQILIKRGIYKCIRHPAYLGLLLGFLGFPLLFSSLYGFLAMLLLIPCILYRISIEEKMLTLRFGDQYLEYVKKSKKLIPFIY